MLFPKGKNTIESLKQSDPDGLNALVQEITQSVTASVTDLASVKLEEAQAKIAKLEEEKGREETNAKITSYGASLKVEAKATELIESKSSFEAALVSMVDEHIKTAENVAESFEETSSEGAGTSGDDDGLLETDPKTFAEAIVHVSERDKCTKMEASATAIKEFPELFKHRADPVEDDE